MHFVSMIIIVGCLFVGLSLLFGKGDWVLKDKNSAQRDNEYDMKKAGRAFGIALIAIGLACLATEVFPSQTINKIYLGTVFVAFVGSIVYMKVFCKR